jgi:RimJ/RimL family protein N-acetyltransferase
MTAVPPAIPTHLETNRLTLRCYRLEDAPAYYRMSLKNQPHLRQFESGNAVMTINSEQDAAVVIRDFVDYWTDRKAFFMGVFLKDTQEFVAQVYVGVVNWALPEFEIGYFADVDYEGNGYVTEAVKGALGFIFDRLGAHRVRLECDDTNLRSIGVAERCGFTLEGHIRETKRHPDGTLTGDLHYGLLRSEYVP